MDTDELKRAAAHAALEHVESGQRLGLGSGSTVAFFVALLAGRVKSGELHGLVSVPTSRETERLAAEAGLTVASLDDFPELDLTVDGADEFTPGLDLVKGLGGALLREKVVASASRRLVIIVDDSKRVGRLGESKPIPVEVLPFARTPVLERLRELGGEPRLRGGDVPFVTDQGNWILDCRFGPIENPVKLATALDAVPGVLEHGLFLGMVDVVFEAGEDGVTTWKKEER